MDAENVAPKQLLTDWQPGSQFPKVFLWPKTGMLEDNGSVPCAGIIIFGMPIQRGSPIEALHLTSPSTDVSGF